MAYAARKPVEDVCVWQLQAKARKEENLQSLRTKKLYNTEFGMQPLNALLAADSSSQLTPSAHGEKKISPVAKGR